MTNNKDSLNDFFNSIGGEKKKIKEEKDKIIGDLSLDNLFSSMEEESRKIKEEKKQLKKDVEAFKNLLFKEEKKEEKPSVDEYIEPPRPEEEIADVIRQSEEDKEETVVEHAVKILDKINEEVETVETEPDLAKLKKEIEILKQVVYEQGGGGEVRLEFLDDVDRDSVKVDGKFLKYQSSTGKFIGADASGGGGGSVGAAGTWAVDSVGINTSKNVGIGTEAKSGFALDVSGNARITGILTIGTQTITLDPNADIIQVGTGITIDANNQKIIVGGSEVADSTGNSKFTGIVTASSFVGNLTGNVSGTAEVATLATNAQGLTGTPNISVVDISSRHINSTGVITATSFSGDGSGLTGVASTDNIITGTAATFNNTVNFNSPILVNNGVSLSGVTTGLNVSGVGTIGTLQATNATISGNLSIGGTLTYEDVTSIDSVGLITARGGMVVSGVSTFLGSQKGINVVGVSSFAGAINASGGVVGNVTGDASGNAGTATKLATARTIGGVSFDGSAAINLPGVNATGNQDTTGNAATATALENARTIGGVSFDGTGNINLPGVNTSGNQDTSGNAATATALENARTIGGVSFDGSANINLPGVNTSGNQDTTGNADTATALATARTIGGVSFDGSANINLPGVNSSGNQDTSGNAATATVATNAEGLTGTPNIAVANVNVSGISTFTGNVTLPDNVELKLGSAGEIRLYHTGSVTNFIVSQHYFNMQANGYQLYSQNGSETIATAYQNGAVSLFFDNTKRIETSPSGVDVSGTLNVTGVSTFSGVTVSGVSTFSDEVHLTTTGNTLRFKDNSGNQTGAIAGNSSNLGFFGHANGNGRFDFYTGGAYRFRIQPGGDINVGTGVTINGVGNATYSGIITATTFVGNVTGNLTGTAEVATLATNAQGLTGTPNVEVGNLTGTSAVVGSAVTVNSTGVDAGAGIVTATKFSGNTAQGGGNDSVFQMNGMTVTQDFEFPDGQSAMSVGPITINSGVEVTVPDGQNWVIL